MKKTIILLIIIYTTITIPVSAKDISANIVMDMDSGRILYQENKDEKLLIASTTKILTAIVTLENIDIKKEITVGEEVLKMYGTNIYIEVGEKITVEDLLYGLLLRSGNDAAVTLAKVVAKDEQKFVSMMNIKAKEIGMTNSHFNNPHGLDEETKNYSTAYDMALLATYANNNKKYREITKTKKYEAKTAEKTYLWYNRNKMLSLYKNCTGGKNGYTPKAGKTLVTTVTKNNLNLTAVTLNDNNIYDTQIAIYEKVLDKYKNYKIIDKENFKIDKTLYNEKLYLKESFTYPLTKEEKDKITTKIYIDKNITKSNEVGRIQILLENKKIGELPIYKKKREEKSFFSKIKDLFS